MPRERFEQISRNLHFVDNEEVQADDDRLWKVIDLFGERFRSVFVPNENISIGETLWKFRGRRSFSTCEPGERARFGSNVNFQPAMARVLAIHRFSRSTLENRRSGHRAAESAPHAEGSEGGTQKRCRLPELQNRHARIDVSVLSTVHTSALELVERGWGPQVSKPQCIVDHNAGMKGVGLGDQLASPYPPVRRSIKWYKKLFFYLFDLATVNAHIIYKYLDHRRQQVDFRLDLGNAIIEEHHPDVDPYGPASLPSPPRLQGGTRHAVRETPGRRYRRCLLCYRAGRRKMTRTMCPVCQVSLLHTDDKAKTRHVILGNVFSFDKKYSNR
nr:uncharacterized protein LOC113826581 [Penaeus vannamei]